MSLRYALLGVLDARPMTGYELAQFFDASMAEHWSAPHSNIYPALRKMEDEGLVCGETDIKGEKLKRTIYSITDDGRRSLREWVVSDPGTPTIRDPLLLRMSLLDIVDPEEAAKLLTVLIERQSELIAQWREHGSALRAKDTPLIRERIKTRSVPDHERMAILKANVFDLRVRQAEAWIEWATKTLAILDDDTGQ